jgi:hypothetical protein
MSSNQEPMCLPIRNLNLMETATGDSDAEL